ncbi:MAG: hypothetical protein JSR66_17865 [Proteobacteria bacterium]|nr:hypothetical protein [Pseudomonadota bacterium]
MHSTESQQQPVSLREVFEVLSGDLNICFAPLQQSMENPDEDGNYTFDPTAARTYVNVAFACIASVATCMRQWATAHLPHDVDEQRFSNAEDMTPLERAIRIGFALLDHVCNVEMQWHASEQWWLSLRRAIDIKYRLASPRSPADLEISAEEIMTVVDAEAGFRLRLAAYLEEPAPAWQLQLTGE